MARILAAHVGSDTRADQIRTALERAGVAASDMQKFYTPPPGQHSAFPIGGDEGTDEGARAAPHTARVGVAVGAAAGAVIGAVIGVTADDWSPLAGQATLPLITALGAGIGALLGALWGTMRGPTRAGKAVTGQQRVQEKPPPERRSEEAARRDAKPVRRGGLMIAVLVRDGKREGAVIDVFRRAGALDIEWAEGRWDDGGWADFDPISSPRLVDNPGRDVRFDQAPASAPR